MKCLPDWRDDGQRHDYCINTACHAPEPEKLSRGDCLNASCHVRRTGEEGIHFHCHACGQCNERRVVLDPHMVWRCADDCELWHESSGVFVRNPDGRFLFFWRSIYPAGSLTVPSGHVDRGETPLQAAIRELGEEIIAGLPVLSPEDFLPIATEDIIGDSCRRGSDAHRWHAFQVVLSSPIRPEKVKVNGEGKHAVLLTLEVAQAVTLADSKTVDVEALTLEEAQQKALSYPVRYVIERHAALMQG